MRHRSISKNPKHRVASRTTPRPRGRKLHRMRHRRARRGLQRKHSRASHPIFNRSPALVPPAIFPSRCRLSRHRIPVPPQSNGPQTWWTCTLEIVFAGVRVRPWAASGPGLGVVFPSAKTIGERPQTIWRPLECSLRPAGMRTGFPGLSAGRCWSVGFGCLIRTGPRRG